MKGPFKTQNRAIYVLFIALLLSNILVGQLYANSKVKRAVSTYLREVKSAKAKTNKAFELEMKSAMKSGDLKKANEIKKAWLDWQEEVKVEEPEKKEGDALVIKTPVKDKTPKFRKLSAMELIMVNRGWYIEEHVNDYYKTTKQLYFKKDRSVTINPYSYSSYSSSSDPYRFEWRVTPQNKLEVFKRNPTTGKGELHYRFFYNGGNRTWLPEYSRNKKKFKIKQKKR